MMAERSKRKQDSQSNMAEVVLRVERLKARNAELKERKRAFLADDDLEFKARYAAMEARLHAIKVVPCHPDKLIGLVMIMTIKTPMADQSVSYC